MKRMSDNEIVNKMDEELCDVLGFINGVPDPLEDKDAYEQWVLTWSDAADKVKVIRAMIVACDIGTERLAAMKGGLYAVEAKLSAKYPEA